jgi:ribosomal protein S18 acetylase RimI-like enzyme
VVDEAFQDHWGHTDRTDGMWQEVIGSAAFRPQWSVLAVDGDTGAAVGAAINCAYEQDWQATGVAEGYTDQLALTKNHRGRGVASALLKESMRRFAASGMDAAALGVDAANSSGALQLYERLGYQQTARTCVRQFLPPTAPT